MQACVKSWFAKWFHNHPLTIEHDDTATLVIRQVTFKTTGLSLSAAAAGTVRWTSNTPQQQKHMNKKRSDPRIDKPQVHYTHPNGRWFGESKQDGISRMKYLLRLLVCKWQPDHQCLMRVCHIKKSLADQLLYWQNIIIQDWHEKATTVATLLKTHVLRTAGLAATKSKTSHKIGQQDTGRQPGSKKACYEGHFGTKFSISQSYTCHMHVSHEHTRTVGYNNRNLQVQCSADAAIYQQYFTQHKYCWQYDGTDPQVDNRYMQSRLNT